MKRHLRRFARRSFLRAFFIFYVLLYPLVALLGAPWAWTTSRGSWGFTPWEEWKEGWKVYSIPSLIEGLKFFWRPDR